MKGHTVVVGRVDHQRQRPGPDTFEKGGKIFFAQGVARNGRRRSVLARHGDAVGHEMLQTSSHPIHPDPIGIIALQTAHGSRRQPGIDTNILSVTLPHPRPSGIASQIHHRRKIPRNGTGTGFISRNLRRTAHQFTVQRGTHVDPLRKKGCTAGVGSTVHLIDTVNAGNPQAVERTTLNPTDNLRPCLPGLRLIERYVENRPDFVMSDDRIEQLIADERMPGIIHIGHHADGQLTHLADFLFKRQAAEYLFNPGFDLRVGPDSGRHCCKQRIAAHTNQQTSYYFHCIRI